MKKIMSKGSRKKITKKKHQEKPSQKDYNSLGKNNENTTCKYKGHNNRYAFIMSCYNTYSKEEYYDNSANLRNSLLKQLITFCFGNLSLWL